MKYSERKVEAIFVNAELVKDSSGYRGDDGYVRKYWFKVSYGSNQHTIIPFILDFTFEIHEVKVEYWYVFKPMRSYFNEEIDLESMKGSVFQVKVSVDGSGIPVSIDRILENVEE